MCYRWLNSQQLAPGHQLDLDEATALWLIEVGVAKATAALDEPPSKPGMRPARVKKDLPVQALQFTLSELRDARLAPIVNFKGRRATEDRSTES